MEDIKILEWITNIRGCGSGLSYGDCSASGYGSGPGYSNCSGYGDGYGSGYGSDDGDGYSSSYGFSYDDRTGCSFECDYSYGIKSFNGESVHLIDEVQTIISNIKGNLARGFILNSDLTLLPCYICKNERYFAHGETLKEAKQALRKKILENMDTDETIERFLSTFEKEKKYPAENFYEWHHYLTGSCEMGRKSFLRDRNIDFDDMYTVDEFIDICNDSFGNEAILKLKEKWESIPLA